MIVDPFPEDQALRQRALEDVAREEIRSSPWYQRMLQANVLSQLRGPTNLFAQQGMAPGGERNVATFGLDAAVDGVSGQNEGVGDGTAVSQRTEPAMEANWNGPAPPLGRVRCVDCNRTYANLDNLHRHRQVMHAQSGAEQLRREEQARRDRRYHELLRPPAPDLADTAARTQTSVSFIPEIWANGVLENIELGRLMADRLQRNYAAMPPVYAGQMNTQQSGYALSQLMTGADAAYRPLRDAIENHAHRLGCTVTCEPGPIPIMCPTCVGVAFYMDRLHGQGCRFDRRQIIKIDGTTPGVRSLPRCGSCGGDIAPRLIGDQLAVYHAADARVTRQMGVRIAEAMQHRLDNEMMSGLVATAQVGREVTFEAINESYIQVSTETVACVFTLRELRVRRHVTANRFPGGQVTPRQTEAIQRWADRWARRHHWLIGTVHVRIEFNVRELRDAAIVSFPACRPPVEMVEYFTRAQIDQIAREHHGHWQMPVLGGRHIEFPRPRRVAERAA